MAADPPDAADFSDPAEPPPAGPRAEVAATAAHAAEVRARAEGADLVEAPLRPRAAAAPGAPVPGPRTGGATPEWERLRPLEPAGPAPPQLPEPAGADRLAALSGVGRRILHLLRRRRPF